MSWRALVFSILFISTSVQAETCPDGTPSFSLVKSFMEAHEGNYPPEEMVAAWCPESAINLMRHRDQQARSLAGQATDGTIAPVGILTLEPGDARTALYAWKKVYDARGTRGGFSGQSVAHAAWISMAANRFERATGDQSFSSFRNDLNDWIAKRSRDPGCAVDSYGALSTSTRASDRAKAAELRSFVVSLFNPTTGVFEGGSKSDERALDVQAWTVLALSEDDRVSFVDRLNVALGNAGKKYAGPGSTAGTFGLVLALRAMSIANGKAGRKDAAMEQQRLADSYAAELLNPKDKGMNAQAWRVLAERGINPFDPTERIR